jgi:hypothetical protein
MLSESGIGNIFDPGSGMEKFGTGINIPNLQHLDDNALIDQLLAPFESRT